MPKHLSIIVLSTFIIFGCSKIPSTEEIDNDLKVIEVELKDARLTFEKYSGGLLADLANVRLETLKATKSMLEQKKNGYHRFIRISYSISGKEYTPPRNKYALLQELENDLYELKKDLERAELESAKYGGGLLGVLSLTQVATVQNSVAFLNQKRLLLKHDIPYFDIIPVPKSDKKHGFKSTPGEDIDKF